MREAFAAFAFLWGCSSGGLENGDVPDLEPPGSIREAPEAPWTRYALPCDPSGGLVLADLDGNRSSAAVVLCGNTLHVLRGIPGRGERVDQAVEVPHAARSIEGTVRWDSGLRERVVLGTAQGFDLVQVSLDGEVGVRSVPATAASWLGSADLDGDGFDDLVVSLPDKKAGVLFHKNPDAWVATQESATWAPPSHGSPALIGVVSGVGVFEVKGSPQGVLSGNLVAPFKPPVQWVAPLIRSAEDGVVVATDSALQVVVPGSAESYAYDSCRPAGAALYLPARGAAYLCPSYVALLTRVGSTKIAAPQVASRLLAGDLDGDSRTDLVVQTRDGLTFTTAF